MLNRRTTSVFSQKDISVCLLAALGHVNTQEDEDHGEGGYGDEAWTIAFYCALKHFDSFEEAMILAVNHGGESDSTGAVTGNILGAAVGYEAIPQFFKDDLEMRSDSPHGGRFKEWLLSEDPQPYNSWGNGSAMRVSPVALYLGTIASTYFHHV